MLDKSVGTVPLNKNQIEKKFSGSSANFVPCASGSRAPTSPDTAPGAGAGQLSTVISRSGAQTWCRQQGSAPPSTSKHQAILDGFSLPGDIHHHIWILISLVTSWPAQFSFTVTQYLRPDCPIRALASLQEPVLWSFPRLEQNGRSQLSAEQGDQLACQQSECETSLVEQWVREGPVAVQEGGGDAAHPPRAEHEGDPRVRQVWCCLQWPTQFRVSLDANTWVWHHGLATSLSAEALHEWVPVSVNERDISNPSVLSESDLFPGSCVLTRVLSLVRPGTPSSPAQEVSREYLINLRRVELCAGLPGYQFR